jgi:hypothetical protein
VAGDLGHETAEGGGFIVLGEAESGGVIAGVTGCAVIAQILEANPVAEILGTDVAEVVLLG